MIWIENKCSHFPNGNRNFLHGIQDLTDFRATIRYRNYAKVSPDTVDTDLEDGEMTPMYRKAEQLSGGGSPIRIQRK